MSAIFLGGRRASRRRSVLAGLAGIAAVGLLAACSGGGGGESPGPSDEGNDLGLPDLSGQTINIASDWSGAEQENFEKVLDVFEEATGASVKYTSLGNNVATVLGTQLKGGNPPNIALIPQPGLLKSLAADGSLIPVSDDVASVIDENYADVWKDLGTVDGTLYGVWFKGSNKSTVWYNTALYDNAGVTPPETWDEFMTAMQTLTDSGVAGVSIGADVGWPLTDWFENVYLRTAGPDMYDQLTEHEIPWTDPSVEEALQLLSDLWSSDTVLSGGAQRTFGDSVIEVFKDDPSAATVYEGDFVAGNIAADTNSEVGTDAKFYNFPSINGSAPSVVGGGNVAVAFVDDDATMALMKFLAMPESANVWIELGGFTSPNQASDLSLYPDDTSRQIAQALVDAEQFRFDMSDLAPSAFGGTEGTGEWQAMIKFYQNPTDVQGAMENLEAEAQSAYSG